MFSLPYSPSLAIEIDSILFRPILPRLDVGVATDQISFGSNLLHLLFTIFGVPLASSNTLPLRTAVLREMEFYSSLWSHLFRHYVNSRPVAALSPESKQSETRSSPF